MLVATLGVAPAAAASDCWSGIGFVGVHGVGQGPDGEGNIVDDNHPREIEQTWDRFRERIDGSDLDVAAPVRHLLPYTSPPVRGGLDLLQDLAQVVALFGQVVDNAAARLDHAVGRPCDDARLVLAGYSMGAWIVGKWLRDHPGKQRQVTGVMLYGDPQWFNNVSGVSGFARYAGSGLPLPYVPAGVDGRLRSLCNHGDPICGEGSSQSLLLRTADVARCLRDAAGCAHAAYVPEAARQGGDFLADLVIAGR